MELCESMLLLGGPRAEVDSHKARLNHAHCSGGGERVGRWGWGRAQNSRIVERLRTDLRLSQIVPRVRFSWSLHPIWPLGMPPSAPAVGMCRERKLTIFTTTPTDEQVLAHDEKMGGDSVSVGWMCLGITREL